MLSKVRAELDEALKKAQTSSAAEMTAKEELKEQAILAKEVIFFPWQICIFNSAVNIIQFIAERVPISMYSNILQFCVVICTKKPVQQCGTLHAKESQFPSFADKFIDFNSWMVNFLN